MSNRNQRLTPPEFAALCILTGVIITVFVIAIFFGPDADAQVKQPQCQVQRLKLPVTKTVAHFEDVNGQPCTKDQKACNLAGYTLYYEVDGKTKSFFSSVRMNSVYHEQLYCY